jgi:hypothetical protein
MSDPKYWGNVPWITITEGNQQEADFLREAVEDVCQWDTFILGVLADPAGHAHLGAAARRSVVERFDLHSVCLPRQLELIERVAAGLDPEAEDAP